MSNENKDKVSWKTVLFLGAVVCALWVGSKLLGAIMSIGT